MPPAVREHVARIRHAGRELLAIVESMLGMNEVLADSPIQAENLSLKTLVESVLELLGEVSQRAGIRLEMAPDQADVRVRADRRWLEQALAGLLVQMLHMQTRGSSLRLQLNQTTSGVGEICLLAPQREDLKPALMRAAGVGGELAAVRRLLARMDGLIHFDPEVDAGMVCRLRLPAETARL